MENVGYARALMQDRLQEIAAVFAMQPWLYYPTLHLSGDGSKDRFGIYNGGAPDCYY